MTAAFKRTEKKFNGFWQADTVEFLIDERKLSIMKLDYISFHMKYKQMAEIYFIIISDSF